MTASMMVAISRAIHRQDWAGALIKLRLAGVPGDAAAHFLAFEIESAETLPYAPGQPR